MARATMTSERGVASLEVVLALPVLWIVLVLIFAFGIAFLEYQRSLVAIREIAMRHNVQLAGGNRSTDGVVQAVTADTLRPRGMTARFEYRANDGTCPVDGQRTDASFARRAVGGAQAMLQKLSSSNTYAADMRGKAAVGRLVPAPLHRRCFVLDSGPWTFKETGSPLRMLMNLGGSLLSRIFS